MAEQFINVKVNAQQAKKEFDDLSESIQLQKEFLAELNLNIVKAEASLKDLTFTQRQARQAGINTAKSQQKVESAALKDLIAKQQGLKNVIKDNTQARTAGTVKAIQFNETLLKNRDISVGLSKITGGLSYQIQSFGKLFLSVGKGVRNATMAMSLFQKALLATGIGAVVVAVGLLAANFEKVKNFITGANPELEKLEASTEKLVTSTKNEITLLQKQKELLKLQGENTEEINKLLLQKFELQKQNLLVLLDELETQLALETEQAKQITFFEKLKIGASTVLPFLKIGEEVAKAVSDENEKTLELSGKIQDTRSKILDLDINIAKVNKEETDEEEKQLKLLDKQLQKEQQILQARIKQQIGAETEIGNIRRDFFKRNLDDQKALLEIERQEQIDRINNTTANEFAKNLAISEVNKFFDQQELERQQKQNNELEKIEQQKRNIRNATFDQAVKLAGEDSRLGKAILVAKTILAAKENLMEVKKTLIKAQQASTEAGIDGAKAGSAVAQGSAETLKVGFPQNIPLIIAYAAQAVAVISAVKAAVSKTKSAAASAGAGGGGGSVGIDVPQVQTAAPSFNVIGSTPENQLAQTISAQTGKPIRTYVVAGDVTTAQGLERNIVEESSLG
tara:strand:+ start:126 stop:1997 length:1872 start_codon:yes stop_codon:yes gene_type:complete